MNTTLINEGHHNVSFWQNLRLVPLFSLIFGGILFLFALCIGISSYFLILSNQSLKDATEEIQVRNGLIDSSSNLRSARLNIIQAGAAARIGEMDDFNANLAATDERIKQAENGLNVYLNRKNKTPKTSGWTKSSLLASKSMFKKA